MIGLAMKFVPVKLAVTCLDLGHKLEPSLFQPFVVAGMVVAGVAVVVVAAAAAAAVATGEAAALASVGVAAAAIVGAAAAAIVVAGVAAFADWVFVA